MSNGKLLSVVIPIYNVEQYLDRCLKSIVNQTYSNLEIILIDDGSTDNCSQKCDWWVQKDSRIIVLYKKNGGASDARNKGLENANGDYIAFVDSDDYIDKNMYSLMIESLERTDSDIATCGRFIFFHGKKQEEFCLDKEVVLSSKQALEELLCAGLVEESPVNKVYKRELFYELCFPAGETNEDMVIMPSLIEKASLVVCTGKPLYFYCENLQSITHSCYSEQQRIVIKHILDISEYMEKKYPEMHHSVQVFKIRYASIFFILFVQNPFLKEKYPNDYEFFKINSKSNLLLLMRTKHISVKRKVELILALAGFYRPIWRFVHFLKKICSQKRCGIMQYH